MCFTAIGSVLTEMVDILQTSTQYMTLYTTFTSVGFLLGSLFGFLIKYLNRQLVLAIFLVAMALGTAFIPHSPNLYVLYTCAIFLGMGTGIINCVVNVWIIEMWGNKSAAILQIPGFTFGLGTVISPLLLKPYLRDPYSGPNSNNATTIVPIVSTVDPVTYGYNLDYEEHRRELLKVPFLILGIIEMIFPVLLFIMFLVKRYQPVIDDKVDNKSVDNNNDTKSNKSIASKERDDSESLDKLFDIYPRYRWPALILLASLVGSFNLFEASYYTFASTYFQYSPLDISASKATEVITAFTTPYTVFRGLSVFIAIKVSTKIMLSSHFVICCIGIVCLAFGRTNMTMLWVANVVIGIGISAIIQSVFAFVGQHIRMTNMVGTVLIVFMSSFNIAPPYIIGLFIKQFSDIFILIESIALGVSIALFAILHDTEHIREEAKKLLYISANEENKTINDEELGYYYMKLHDFDGNDKLDGIG
ncbi:sodium-dependent glucose transporter 1B-like [Oppia nitens]|uniref:sodium-dependent glucose transporter 1B-like n=1 Tax=Oppia nitens TaxID=1686743 RepID=UPI0023DA81F2|nr:sodium-dependent glucose transporter 1B-like [Oppia nitens]